jgi:hypothetical protein
MKQHKETAMYTQYSAVSAVVRTGVLTGLAAAVLVVGVPAPAAYACGGGPCPPPPPPARTCPDGTVVERPKPGHIAICHATGSTSNPYVVIYPSENSQRAHDHHQHDEDVIFTAADF